jgi:NADH-quinone oxidoreductase subunit L
VLPPETATMGAMTIATLLLFLGATGKSAQIPLYTWLPDAMEGPTPVSALIHAATMVTAGVYMIGRNAVLFSHAPTTLAVVAGVGVATALLAGTIGLVQNDIKRVLAYSTVSQLGYMFLAMGVGAYAAGIFHLYTHAFFKALLFLGSGAVIHALAGEQDLRNMGGLKKYLPITYWTFLIGALAIAGVPLLSGFFSKDEILFRTFTAEWPRFHLLLWGIGVVTSLLTAVYMFRLVFLAFHGERRENAHGGDHPEEEEPVRHIAHVGGAHGAAVAGAHAGHGAHGHGLHDAPMSMAIPLIVLALGSILAGYVGVPHALGGSNRIESFLHPSFQAPGAAHDAAAADADGSAVAAAGVRAAVATTSGAHAQPADDHAAGANERTELMLMALSSGIAVAGIGIAAFFWLRRRDVADAMAHQLGPVYRTLCRKYYVDELYDATIVHPIQKLSTSGLWKGVDATVIDGLVNGVGIGMRGSSSVLRRMQSGSIRTYAASLFLGVVLILGWYLAYLWYLWRQTAS